MKEKIKNRFDKLTIKQLWMAYIIVLLIDIIHVEYLTAKYNIKAADIFNVVGFYWLSPLIGFVELIIGILILYKNSNNYDSTFQNIYFFNIPFTAIELGINVHWLAHKTNKFFAWFIVSISILALVEDFCLFFQI